MAERAAELTFDGDAVISPTPKKFARTIAYNVLPLAGSLVDDGEGEKEFQKVEVKSVIAVADQRPNDFYIGQEYSNGSSLNINPEDFLPQNLSRVS
jgi:aspartate-semialdehyde dehydrogenase